MIMYMEMKRTLLACIVLLVSQIIVPVLCCKPSVLMRSGDTLAVDDVIQAPTIDAFITQQADGNIVLHRGSPSNRGDVLWSSGYINNNGGSYYSILQGDGNWLTKIDETIVWASNSHNEHTNNYILALNCDSHSMSIYKEMPDHPVWTVGTYKSFAPKVCKRNIFMTSGDVLAADEVREIPGAFIKQQRDGNVVLRNGSPNDRGDVLWESGYYVHNSHEHYHTKLQFDGNFVTRIGSTDVWASHTHREHSDYFLALACDRTSMSIYQGTPDNPGLSPTWTVPISSFEHALGLSYEPGIFTHGKMSDDGLIKLSNGLSARLIATKGQHVSLARRGLSAEQFHSAPDGAAVYEKEDGGWIYVSNGENVKVGMNWDDGGVGAIEFDSNGEVVQYRKIAGYTRRNCGGGKTPWNSWITGEEAEGGYFHQVDPFGRRPAARLPALGNLGWYESFAADDGTDLPTFYMTRDVLSGVITRFVPNEQGYQCYRAASDYDRWCTLEHGHIDYLYLTADGRVEWTSDYEKASARAAEIHPNCEGVVVKDGVLHFTAKQVNLLFRANLRTLRYDYTSTLTGRFANQPDQLALIEGDESGLLYMCEDGGNEPGLYARNDADKVFTILHASGLNVDETTGVAFSPDSRHLYLSFQAVGKIYDVTRDDGRSFREDVLNVDYHIGT